VRRSRLAIDEVVRSKAAREGEQTTPRPKDDLQVLRPHLGADE
jgi:hypothetical protein